MNFLIFLLLAFQQDIFPFAHANDCHVKQGFSNYEKSIYQIIPINPYARGVSKEIARQVYLEHCQEKDLLLINNRLNCENLKTCQSENDCKTPFLSHGSGFFVGENKTLLTAWHVVFPTHAPALNFLIHNLQDLEKSELNEKLRPLKPKFLIFNYKGEKVFDSREQKASYLFWGDPLSPIYQSRGHKNNNPYGHFENLSEDYVAISLDLDEQQTIETLPINLNYPVKTDRKNQCLYAFGYEGTSQAQDLQVKVGLKTQLIKLQKKLNHVIDFQINPLPYPIEVIKEMPSREILSLMGYDEDEIKATYKRHPIDTIERSIQSVLNSQPRYMRDQLLDENPKALFFNAQVLPGQSGGPIINHLGEVVAITTNGFLNRSPKDPMHFHSVGGAGVLLSQFKAQLQEVLD